MMRRALAFCLATLTCAPVLLESAPAAAQGDWDVKRDPFDRRLVARYKRILQKSPGDQRAMRKLVRLYSRYRSVELLIKEYEKELSKHPERFSALVVLGHLHLGQKQRDQARTYYERAAELRPKNITVQLSLGELYRQTGEPKKAQQAFDRALAAARGPKEKKEILRSLADIALDRGDIDSAKGYYEKYLALDPKDVQVRVELADALLQHERHEEAIEAYRAAEKRLRSDPAMRVQIISRLGSAYEAAGEEDAAIREYRRAMSMTRRGYYLRKELTARVIDIYRRRQDLRSLIDHYEKQWPARRRDHFEWDVLARLYEEVGLQDKAIAAYRKATKKAPYELDTQRRLITLLENSGREDEAIRQYEVVIRVAPGEPRFQLELAQRYREIGKKKQALAILRRVQRRFPSDAGVHSALADLYTRWGEEDLALEAYVRLTNIEPSDVNHLVNLGEQYWLRNKKKKAQTIWRRIIARKTPENYARLGEVFAEHDLLGDALQMYAKAIKLAPKKADSYRGRAGVYERQRRYTEAIADWERVLALTPDKKANRPARSEARRRVVSLLKRAGGRRLHDRMAAWSRAFRKTPPDLGAGYYLVEAHLRQNEYSKARGVLERLLSVNPEDTDAMHQLVKVYRAQRDWDRAVAMLERLAAVSPGREREYYNKIAEIKTIQKKDDEAIEYALKALEKSPNDPVAHQRLAERFEDMQKYGEAVKAYEKTIELDPRNYKAYFSLARLYRNRDEREKAAELYREVLRRATEDDIIHKAGRMAINLEELTGTLGDLERVVAPLAFTFGHKDVYRRILVELYDRYVPGLVAEGQGSSAETARAAAELERLGEHGLKPLLEALSDEKDVSQQRIAVKVLGYLGNRGAAPPLVKLAKQPSSSPGPRRPIGTFLPTLDWDVRVQALVAAGRLGDPRTIPDLVELAEHRESSMREAAVFALGMTRDARALGPLLSALDDNLDGVQMLGCLGLAHVGNPKAVPAIIDVVESEKRHDLSRAACAFALGVLGDRRAVGPLAETLAQGNDEAQRLSAWALGRIGHRDALPALLSAYFSKRPRIRETIAWSLPRVAAGGSAAGKGEEALAGFMDYPMRNGKLDGRAALRNLIPELDAPELVPSLIVGRETELAGGIREALRRHRDVIVSALADLDRRDRGLALGPLTRRLDEAPRAVRRKVEGALDRIGHALIPELTRLASHRDPMVRRRSLSVLAKIGDPAAEPVLKAALRDETESVRRAALEAAAHYARRRGKSASGVIRALAGQLGASDWQERMAAASALGALGPLAPSRPLVAALAKDPKSFVREAAAEALGRVGGKRALGALSGAADHTREINPHVRGAAARALAAIGGPRAARVLRRVTKEDPDREVREAAASGRQPKRKK